MIVRWYQLFSYWIFLWYAIYIHLGLFNPFIAFVFVLFFDLYFVLNNRFSQSFNGHIPNVHFFRIILMIMLHYIPLIKLNSQIQYESILILSVLSLLYVKLNPKWLSYYFSHSSSSTVVEFLNIRFGHYLFGIVFVGFVLYTLSKKVPAKQR
jgi:hypothetical protein